MTPTEIMARTLWGEARSDGISGMTAVGSVIMNRVASPGWWGHDIESVCLKPWQFSCWNVGDPNLPKLRAVTENDAEYAEALEIAELAVADKLIDITSGATSYKTTALPWPKSWGRRVSPVAMIGSQSFYVLPIHSASAQGAIA